MSLAVYKSSAGSGKTFTLVKEYLKAVISKPEDFRHILAITFTNKAANEMKERVIDSLKMLSDPDQNSESPVIKFILPELLETTSLDKGTIRNNAAKALSLILHYYSDFGISTIDSFVHKIVKSFAHDLHLPMNFEIELEADKLLQEAVNVLISQVGSDEDLTNILLNFTRSKLEDETDWNIEQDLLNFSRTLFSEDSISKISCLSSLNYKQYLNISKSLNSYISNFKKEVSAIAKEAIKLIDEKNLSVNDFWYSSKSIGVYFRKLSKPTNEDFKANSYAYKTVSEDKWLGSKISPDKKAAIENIQNELSGFFNDIEELKRSGLSKFRVFKLLQKQIYAIAVLGEMEKIISVYKDSNNMVHISEFNKKISEVVSTEPVPFIYERMGEKYKCFMIDEFQDTSIMQWQNLLPLIENALSEGNFNMIVGDGKQAIYRWRSGEVEQFSSLPKIYKGEDNEFTQEREQTLIRNYEQKILNKNYRSKREIIEFNNDLFNQLQNLLPESLKKIYDNQEQEFDPDNTGGYVSLEFINKSEEEDDVVQERSCQIIKELINSGYSYKDISILCRKNDKASAIALFLMKNDVPVLSSESLILGGSPKLNLIISCVRFLKEPTDQVNKANILQQFCDIGRLEESLDHYIHRYVSEDINFVEFFNDQEIELNPKHLLSLPIYDLCEQLVRSLDLQSPADPYTQFFLDAALKLTVNGLSNIQDLIDWWEDRKNKESVIIPEGIDAVNILTVHKSKGLEFPIVIYPYANDEIDTKRDRVWVDINYEEIKELKSAYIPLSKEKLSETDYESDYNLEHDKSLLDVINLMYVAFTRASKQLYVISDRKLRKDIKGIPEFLTYYLKANGSWDAEKQKYEFGEFHESEKSTEDEEAFIQLNELPSNDWRSNLLISNTAPEIWDVLNPERHKEWGNLIHEIFSRINTSEDLPNVIEAIALEGMIKDIQKEELLKYIEPILLSDEIKVFFSKGLNIRNEADILLENGQSIRPDRIVLKDNETQIIDYKTGRMDESHKKQIRNYGFVLRKMGYPNVKLYLIYLNKKVKLLQVDF